MSLRIKLDEALSDSMADALRDKGYSVATVREQGWGGFKDSTLWPMVVEEGVFFITTDKEFGDINKHPPGTYPGILLLRPNKEGLSAYRNMLEMVLDRHALTTLVGTVTVASLKGIRIRRKIE